MLDLKVGVVLAIIIVAIPQVSRAESHSGQTAQANHHPVDSAAAACGLSKDEVMRALPFLAQTGNVSFLIKQGIDQNRLGEVGAQAGMLLCYEMGKAVTALRLLKIVKDEDKQKVDDICTQTRLFGSLSRENLMTLKDIADSSGREVNRRYFPESVTNK